ncbi:MAG: hypothetical protein LBF26_01725 [Puniceicoccales bacterium]|jgi:hypothetical protein|nr:hypothetical protein [Puniceicoccales bacterium]
MMRNFFQTLLTFVTDHRLGLVLLATAAVGSFVLWRFIRCWRRKILIADGEWGTVSVSVRAIRGTIRGICDTFSPAGHPCIRIREKKSVLSIAIHLQAPFGCNVPELSRQIQEAIASNLREQFGFSAVGPIDVVISHFHPCCQGNGRAF